MISYNLTYTVWIRWSGELAIHIHDEWACESMSIYNTWIIIFDNYKLHIILLNWLSTLNWKSRWTQQCPHPFVEGCIYVWLLFRDILCHRMYIPQALVPAAWALIYVDSSKWTIKFQIYHSYISYKLRRLYEYYGWYGGQYKLYAIIIYINWILKHLKFFVFKWLITVKPGLVGSHGEQVKSGP